MSLDIKKQEGELLHGPEINTIATAINANDDSVNKPAYSLSNDDFQVDNKNISLTPEAGGMYFYGTQFVGDGSETNPFRINPNLLDGNNPGVIVEQLITGCNYNNSPYTIRSPDFESVSFYSKRTMFVASKELRFEWANNSNSVTDVYRDRVGLNNITIKASVKHNGITYPINFSGVRSKTLVPGEIVKSDIVNLEVRANDQIQIIVYVTVPAGGEIPVNRTTVNNNGEGFADFPRNVDYTDGGTPGQIIGSTIFDCTGIYGKPLSSNTDVVLLMGDSIMSGYGSNTPIRNHFERALASLKIPYFNISLSGDKAIYFNSTTYSSERRKHITVGKFTTIFSNYGTNDIQNGGDSGTDTINSLKALFTAIKALVGGTNKLYQTTLFPKTNSINNWTNGAGQSFVKESPRVQVNTFVRTTPTPLTGFIDVNSEVETNINNVLTLNGGYWATNGTPNYSTTDGVNPSDNTYQIVGNAIKPFLSTILS